MKVSYHELNTRYFDGTLPAPEALAEALTFHAWEIEEVTKVGNDTVLDVKVLPDKSAWALSHRGIAKDISAILNIPLAQDPFAHTAVLEPRSGEVSVEVATPTCDRYTAALIRGIKVGESPAWLKDFLASMGQRSINNVVDITNYVMFSVGQPLHAFDAGKLSHEGGLKIVVRNARENEPIMTLTGESYSLSTDDTLIVDGGTDTPVGIAGIKGGKVAEVDVNTVDILLESAHFDAVKTRKSSQRLKLRTDASQRYENGVSRGVAAIGITEAVALILKECGGELIGYTDTNPEPLVRENVMVTLLKINSVLGLTLASKDIELILKRFGFVHTSADDVFVITPPFERPDLVIAEDVIEEIGRIYGYEHVPSIAIEPILLREVNKRFFYAEQVRDKLVEIGFSEIFTSSFRDVDEIKIKNALASDKGYLRSSKGIVENMKEALAKNAPNADLFGDDQIRIFEFGKVFDENGEREMLVIGVQSKQGYIAKKDRAVLRSALLALTAIFGGLEQLEHENIWSVDMTSVLNQYSEPEAYATHEKSPDVTYKPFSTYPYLTRDIAFWTSEGTEQATAEKVIRESVGPLAHRIDCFDQFTKEGRVSYGFRIVFQSYEKTLTSDEADALMQTVSAAVGAKGWEVR